MKMIRLTLPTEPYWIDPRPGLRVQVKPLTTAVYGAARSRGAAKAAELRTHRDAVTAAGGTVAGLPDLDDPHVRQGILDQLLAESLAVYAIVAWEGVGEPGLGQDDVPAPVTPENLEAFARLGGVADDFVTAYLMPLAEAAAEGNASGPGPNGTSAPGPTTAAAVPSKARRAPGEKKSTGKPAPTTKTSRKASKEKRPGVS